MDLDAASSQMSAQISRTDRWLDGEQSRAGQCQFQRVICLKLSARIGRRRLRPAGQDGTAVNNASTDVLRGGHGPPGAQEHPSLPSDHPLRLLTTPCPEVVADMLAKAAAIAVVGDDEILRSIIGELVPEHCC